MAILMGGDVSPSAFSSLPMRFAHQKPGALLANTWRFVLLGLIASCASARPSGQPAAAERFRTDIRETSYTDSELAARGLGRLEIVIRSADRPTQTLVGAAVSLTLSGREPVRYHASEQDPVIRIDSLPIGEYQVRGLAIGYAPEAFPVTVTAGCRTDVEIYLGLQAIGIAPPPPMLGRATITTCRPGQ